MARHKWIKIKKVPARGKWFPFEDWCLRQGVMEVSGKLAPTSDVLWHLVHNWVPHRDENGCRQRWYAVLLPRLLAYKAKHGVPIDPEVFRRRILRNLRKGEYEDETEVPWIDMNTF